jgi:Caspase domain
MTALVDEDGRPGTHALVIGVGTYRHLKDPMRPRVKNLRLGSLTSPPESAARVADWLLEELHNERAPLRSLELLLSAQSRRYRSPSGRIDMDVEPATTDNVVRAWDRWFNRCNHEENIAFFFFSGHGTAKGHLALLLEDFGEVEERMFDHAVAFDASHEGFMTQCRARAQWFFADACRQVPYEALEREKAEGRTLTEIITTQSRGVDAPRYFATPPTNPAYGVSGQPTAFTQALLAALRGAGSSADRHLGKWVIRADGLQNGIRETMRVVQRALKTPDEQKPTIGGEQTGESFIHVFDRAPLVPLTITLDPAAAHQAAELFVASQDGSVQQRQPPGPGPWDAKPVPLGDYSGGAHFAGGEFIDYRSELFRVEPPIWDYDLWRVTPR